MFKKLLFILTVTVLASVSGLSIEAKEVDWKVLQGLTVEEKKGKPVPKLSKELKVAMSNKISIKDINSAHVMTKGIWKMNFSEENWIFDFLREIDDGYAPKKT